MAAFSEILPLFGVDAAKGFMMAPVGGFNLIYHFLGKDASFSANTKHGLSIRDVTEEIRKAPDVSKISKNPKQPLFIDKDDMTRRSSKPLFTGFRTTSRSGYWR